MLDFIYNFGSGFCHQIPERSFFFSGLQMPLCSRCSGIYFAFVATIITLYLINRKAQKTRYPSGVSLAVLGVFVGVMAIDGLSSYLGFRDTNNWIRLITGSCFGVALASFSYPLVNSTLLARQSEEPLFSRKDKSLYLLMILPYPIALLYLGLGSVSGYIPLFLTVDLILSTFSYVVLVLVAMHPRFYQKVARLQDAFVPLLISIGIAAALLALLVIGQNLLRASLVL